MKKILSLATSVAVAVALSSCGGSQQVASSGSAKGGGSPVGEVHESPCTIPDTDDEFGATGIANGPQNWMNVLQTRALTNARNLIFQKIQHAYIGAIDHYNDNNVRAKLERAGMQITIDWGMNNIRMSCGPKFTAADERGEIMCFVGIRVNKKPIVDVIVDHVLKDEELKDLCQEEEFRKWMDESFKKYKVNNQ
jgi:hypothetical protein